MKGILVFLLCFLSFLAGGWVAGPWLTDRAVDRFITRLRTDPQLAGQVATALVNNPGFRQALVSQTGALVQDATKRMSAVTDPQTIEELRRTIERKWREAAPSAHP